MNDYYTATTKKKELVPDPPPPQERRLDRVDLPAHSFDLRVPEDVSRQLIDYCAAVTGFPADSHGILLNSAVLANLEAIIYARNSINKLIRRRGVRLYGSHLVMYASAESHTSVQTAADILGIGSEAVRMVKVNALFQMDTVHLEALIAQDRSLGHLPFCVLATAGTHGSGAIDPLGEIGSVCKKNGLWFHVDGTIGAVARQMPEYVSALQGIGNADSLAMDLYRDLPGPYRVSVLLTKNNQGFLVPGAKPAAGHFSGSAPDRCLQYKALHIWKKLAEAEREEHIRLQQQNFRIAALFGLLLQSEPWMEIMVPVSLNIVCFRYNPGLVMKWELNEINERIIRSVGEEQGPYVSGLRLRDEICIRVEIADDYFTEGELKVLIQRVMFLGREFSKERYWSFHMAQSQVA